LVENCRFAWQIELLANLQVKKFLPQASSAGGARDRTRAERTSAPAVSFCPLCQSKCGPVEQADTDGQSAY
jgi:hypothetical protein